MRRHGSDPELALRLLEAQAGAGVGAWTFDFASNESVWTDEMHHVFGTDPDTFVPTAEAIVGLAHPDDRDMLRGAPPTAREGSRLRFRVEQPDGTLHWIELWTRVVVDAAGDPLQYFGTAQDVTADQRRQHELVNLKEMLEDAEEMAGAGSWQVDFTTGRSTWSRGLHRMCGTDPETYVPTPTSFRDFTHPADRPELEASVDAFFGGTATTHDATNRVVRADGAVRSIHVHNRIERSPDGRPLRLIGTGVDVTDMMRLQQEAAQSAALLEDAQHLARVGSWRYDGVADEMVCSETMAEILGVPGQTQLSLVSYMGLIDAAGLERMGTAVADAIAGDGIFEVEYDVQRPDGDVRNALAVGRVTPIGDTGEVSMIGTMQDVTDLRRTERELKVRGELLEEAQEIAGVGSWSVDFRTGETSYTPQMMRIFGIDQLSGWTFSQENFTALIHPDDRAKVETANLQAVLTGGTYMVEHRAVRPDGEERIVLARGKVETENGQPVAIRGVAQDITEMRQAEQELQRHGELLEDAQTIAGFGSWSVDGTTGEMAWSEELRRIFGVADVPGWQLTMEAYEELVHPDDWHLIEDSVARVVAAGGGTYTVEHRLIRPNGDERILFGRGRIAVDEHGAIRSIQGTGQDITELRRAEQEVVEARDLFEALLGSATDQAIMGIGLDGNLTLWNQGAERMLGWKRDDVLGRSPWSFLRTEEALDRLSGGDDVDAAYRTALGTPVDNEHGRPRRFLPGPEVDREWLTQDGRTLLVQVSITPMRDHTGEATGYLAIATDVTETRRIERERDESARRLREAMAEVSTARDEALAANAAKSAFLATMSHEIRTPMNAVIGMTGLLLDTPLDGDQRDLLETVRSSGDQLLAVINDVLDFSKIEAGELDLESRPFDLHELVEGAVAQFAGSTTGLELVSFVDPACPAVVRGDLTRLRQVLANLVGNAVKFTHQGDVLVTVAPLTAADPDHVQLRFQVRDTGIGIPADSMDRLFKSFSQVDASTTRTYGGTGLGLAICQGLVTAMGGTVGVESTPGVGSTFSFTVLLGRSADEGARPVRPAALVGRRALVVDANATHRRILRLQLTGLGMDCREVPSGEEALRMLADPGQRFDVALLELAVPGSDPVALARRIRALPAGAVLPLVAMSPVGRRPEDDESLFAAVLTKPLRGAQLVAGLADAVAPASAGLVPPAPRRAEDPATGGGLRILLAEDNEVNQKVGRLMLAKLGHHVQIANNGSEALAAAHAHDHDVVLMDMHMPVMDGLEATRRIRAELPADRQPRIVALTASVTLEDREACVAAGMDGFLTKPVRAAELAEALSGSDVTT